VCVPGPESQKPNSVENIAVWTLNSWNAIDTRLNDLSRALSNPIIRFLLSMPSRRGAFRRWAPVLHIPLPINTRLPTN
jgi:hypothetical protein